LFKGEDRSARIRIKVIMIDQRRHHRELERPFNPSHRCSGGVSPSLVHPHHHLHEVPFLDQSHSPNNGIPHNHQSARCHYKNKQCSTIRDFSQLSGVKLSPRQAMAIKKPASSPPCKQQEKAKTMLPGTQTFKWTPTNTPRTISLESWNAVTWPSSNPWSLTSARTCSSQRS
jgi:hypothetical protein